MVRNLSQIFIGYGELNVGCIKTITSGNILRLSSIEGVEPFINSILTQNTKQMEPKKVMESKEDEGEKEEDNTFKTEQEEIEYLQQIRLAQVKSGKIPNLHFLVSSSGLTKDAFLRTYNGNYPTIQACESTLLLVMSSFLDWGCWL